MAFMKCDDLIIPIFDGTKYNHWKMRLFKYLEFEGCKVVVERETDVADNEMELKKQDIKFTNYK